jgi:hypothetical protein
MSASASAIARRSSGSSASSLERWRTCSASAASAAWCNARRIELAADPLLIGRRDA